MKKTDKIAVLLACYNRQNKTLACLNSLFDARIPTDYMFEVFLVDDGSSDGTGLVVKEKFPQVNVINGTGGLFWGWGMNLAWETAIEACDFDFYLWLNDDVTLYENSLVDLLKESKSLDHQGIICGVCEASDKSISYSGYDLKNRKRLVPTGQPLQCDYFNGNAVLIPKIVFNKVGFIDPIFQHRLGDFDYGLRAKKANIQSYISSDVVAKCDRHAKISDWCNPSISFRKRMRAFASPSGGCPKTTFIIRFRHAGFFTAIFHFTTIYLRLLIPTLWVIMKKDQI